MADTGPGDDTACSSDTLLAQIAENFLAKKNSSPQVPKRLADIVKKWWSEKLSNSKLKEKKEKHAGQENCKKLVTPRVNLEI